MDYLALLDDETLMEMETAKITSRPLYGCIVEAMQKACSTVPLTRREFIAAASQMMPHANVMELNAWANLVGVPKWSDEERASYAEFREVDPLLELLELLMGAK